MGMLLNRLLVILMEEDIDSTSYHIAMTMLKNFDRISVMSISQIASLCHVSKSTISKFCRKIGFDDYFDLKDSVPNRPHGPYSYNDNIMNYMESHPLDDYLQMIITDVRQLNDSIDRKKIDMLAKDLMKYDHVAAFGLLYSQTAAIDLQIKLAYNHKFIFTSMNDVKQHEYIANAKEDTLIIIFSHTGDYLKKYQLADGDIHKNVFDRTKAKIVVISANAQLEKYDKVHYCITYPQNSAIATHSILYTIITDAIVLRYRYFSQIENS